jgi:hypothetical protein
MTYFNIILPSECRATDNDVKNTFSLQIVCFRLEMFIDFDKTGQEWQPLKNTVEDSPLWVYI